MTPRVLILLVPLLAGCTWFTPSDEAEGTPLARVYDDYLYLEDIRGMTAGTSPADSADLVERYVNRWVADQLLLRRAEENLSVDIDRKVEEYRRNLLLNAYRTQLLEQKVSLDVTNEQLDSAYSSLAGNFLLEAPARRMRYVLLDSSNAEYAEELIDWLNDETTESMNQALEVVSLHAIAWQVQKAAWVAGDVYLDELRLDDAVAPSDRYRARFHDDGSVVLFRIEEVRPAGEPAPLDLVRDEISDIVIFKRRENFLDLLEERTFRDAQDQNAFEILL